MALMEKDVSTQPQADANASDTLTFVTSEGEHILFDGMNVSAEEAAVLIGEDALGKIWNRPAEDLAWQDM